VQLCAYNWPRKGRHSAQFSANKKYIQLMTKILSKKYTNYDFNRADGVFKYT